MKLNTHQKFAEMRKKFSFLSASIVAILPFVSFQVVAQQALVTEDPWGQTMTQTAMNTVYGVGNYTLINSYSSANPSLLFSPNNNLVFLEGGADTAANLQAFLSTNQPTILNWVASGKKLIVESAGWYGTSVSIGPGTLNLNNTYTTGSFSGNLTSLGISKFVFYPAAPSVSGSYLAHDYISLSSGELNTYATGNTDAFGTKPIVAGFKYGKGYIMLSGLTFPAAQDPSNNNWLEI